MTEQAESISVEDAVDALNVSEDAQDGEAETPTITETPVEESQAPQDDQPDEGVDNREEEQAEESEVEEIEDDEAVETDLDDLEEEEEAEEIVDEAAMTPLADDMPVQLPDGSTVTVAELKQGNMMNADYTRKTQELAFEKQQLQQIDQQREQAFKQVLDATKARLEMFDSSIDQQIKEAEEYGNDLLVLQLKQKKHDLRDSQQQIAQQQQLMNQQEELKQAEQRAQLKQEAQQYMVDKIPAWGDPEKGAALDTQVTQYLIKEGFKPDEISTWDDGRSMLIAYKASMYDKSIQTRKKAASKVKDKPSVVKPSARTSASTQSRQGLAKAKTKLTSTGSIDDAFALVNRLTGVN